MDITINYLAVLVAAIVNMIVGSLWYGPVFGKMWMGLMGFTKDSIKDMTLATTQAIAMGFVTSLIMAYVLAHFVFMSGAIDVGSALTLAFWIWLGFMLTNTASSFLWEGKPFKLFVLNAAEQFVALALMTIVITLWQ